MYRASVCIVLALFVSASALGTPYWVAWEGDDFPESQGWTRHWGNWSGPYQGSGAQRTLQNGVLTYDSRYDGGVYDYSAIRRAVDPAPGELFVVEWRLLAEQDATTTGDPVMGVGSDTAMLLAFQIRRTEVHSLFEQGVSLPITPGLFHDYRVTSADMLTYRLFIDGVERRTGSFWQGLTSSFVEWGDLVQSHEGGSLHRWDYVRFGVVPEPGALALLGVVIACCVGRRR